ncbi:hypothetical protein C8J57DRAFT_1540131 [Mycena rebaudengoi]|nr:hypothetical protein C8J57DRAFT_1540131 [Mycena rebaudengoi]
MKGRDRVHRESAPRRTQKQNAVRYTRPAAHAPTSPCRLRTTTRTPRVPHVPPLPARIRHTRTRTRTRTPIVSYTARAGAVDRSHAHIPHRPAARAPQRAKAYPTFPPRPLRAHPSCVAAHASPPTPQSYAVRSPIARTPTSHMALRIPAAREHNENGGQSGVARATGVRTCCMGPIRCTEQDTCVPAAPSAPPHTTTLAHRRIPATRKWRERLEVPKEERTAGRRRACAVVGVLKRTVGAGAPWWAAGRRRGTTKAWRRSPDTAQVCI